MPKASEYSQSDPIAVIIAGPPKSGKTTLASQFPKPHFIDCDGNMRSAVLTAKQLNLSLDFSWDSVNIKDDGSIVPRKERFARLMTLAQNALNSPDYRTIVFDSLITLDAIFLDKVREDQKRGFGIDSGSDFSKKLVDGQLKIQDYIQVKALYFNLFSIVRTAGKHIVFTAHTKYKDDEHSKELNEVIAITGETSKNAGSFFTDVWLAEIESKVDAKGTTYKRFIRSLPRIERQKSLGLGNTLGLAPKTEFSEVLTKLKELK